MFNVRDDGNENHGLSLASVLECLPVCELWLFHDFS